MNSKVHKAILVLVSLLVLVSTGAWISTSAAAAQQTALQADDPCSCLVFFENYLHLPQAGRADFPAFQYGDQLPNLKPAYAPRGYTVTYLDPYKLLQNGSLAWDLNGAAIVFLPGKDGSSPVSGHIGIVHTADYNWNKGLWTFYYRDAGGWASKGPDWEVLAPPNPFYQNGCPTVQIRHLVTSVIDGRLRFFKWWQK